MTLALPEYANGTWVAFRSSLRPSLKKTWLGTCAATQVLVVPLLIVLLYFICQFCILQKLC